MSKTSVRVGVALAGASFLTLVIAVAVAIADAEQKPVAGIQNIMVAINDDKVGMYAEIKKFCAGNPGKDQADMYKLMRHRAQVMAECGNVLMTKSAPRGADDAAGIAKWKQHCADYREACRKLSKALAMKNAKKASAAITALDQQCTKCHDDHQSK